MQGEKECSYYMKTGHCKFGGTCKFHHPELGILSETPTMYPPVQPSPVSSPHPYPHLANWQMGRPPVVPGSFLPGSYPPMMLPPTLMPMQGWNPYIVSFNCCHFILYFFPSCRTLQELLQYRLGDLELYEQPMAWSSGRPLALCAWLCCLFSSVELSNSHHIKSLFPGLFNVELRKVPSLYLSTSLWSLVPRVASAFMTWSGQHLVMGVREGFFFV